MSVNLERVHNFLIDKNLLVTDLEAPRIAQGELQLNEEEVREFFGHGPISNYLLDDKITEILVNGPNEIWIETETGLQKTQAKFSSEEALKRYVRRVLAGQGKKVDHLNPFSDGLLDGKFRLHVILPPISKHGICLSIRKFSSINWTIDRIITSGGIAEENAKYLRRAVLERKNIFLSGGTSTGKTSLLAALLSEVPINQRIIALEDVAELRLDHPHFLSLESRVPNQEGEGEVSLRRLLKESLRMRPDRIVMGECRGGEALDLLLTLNSGHQGSMGTIHASSPREALHKLETLALLAAENLKQESVRALIAGCVDIVLQLERINGLRKVTAIAEIKGVDCGNYLLKEIKS